MRLGGVAKRLNHGLCLDTSRFFFALKSLQYGCLLLLH